MTELLRLYEPDECGADGYPREWHMVPELGYGIKHMVRAEARDRCVRCLHPYPAGSGEWSQCDTLCRHFDDRRATLADGRRVELGLSTPDGRAIYDVRYRVGKPAFLVEVPGPMTPPGAGEIDRIEARWRILTVHHLDIVKANCRWWNLAALCQRCHLQIQGKVQMARVWPWEHSDWFKPYVAGYYAHVYLGEDLDREQTVERLDELLDLERAA